MPFEEVRIEAAVQELRERGATFRFDYYRRGPESGDQEKVAVGTQEVAWLATREGRAPSSSPWPLAVKEALLRGCG